MRAEHRDELEAERKDHRATLERFDRLDTRASELQARVDAFGQEKEALSAQLREAQAEATAAANRAETTENQRHEAERRADTEGQRAADARAVADEARAAAAARDEERRAAEGRARELERELADWQRAYREISQRSPAARAADVPAHDDPAS